MCLDARSPLISTLINHDGQSFLEPSDEMIFEFCETQGIRKSNLDKKDRRFQLFCFWKFYECKYFNVEALDPIDVVQLKLTVNNFLFILVL
jgi:hypothetical protein